MGERANIVMLQSGGNSAPLYFYTHWEGHELPSILQDALIKRWRWDDEQYLARIIFCALVGEHMGEEGGYGISTCIHDNGYPLLVVDASTQRVCVAEPNTIPAQIAAEQGWSFDEFCALPLADEPWDVLSPPEEEEHGDRAT